MSNMLTPPLHLYHYTSIDTLALILKTRKIKLNRLDQLNDPTEEVSRDGRYGKYLFVTCWTSESSEILPFWYMYGHNRRGVRIQLPNNFIKTYTVRERYQESDGSIIYGKSFEGILPEERFFLQKIIGLRIMVRQSTSSIQLHILTTSSF